MSTMTAPDQDFEQGASPGLPDLAPVANLPAVIAPARAKPGPLWHRRVMQSLLYGRNVDRAGKTRARLGIAMVLFAMVYGIIALRLVIYAIGADSHMARR